MTTYEEIKDILDDVSRYELVAQLAFALGIATQAEVSDVAHSSISIMIRNQTNLLRAFKLMLKEELMMDECTKSMIDHPQQVDVWNEFCRQGCYEEYSI